MTTGSQGTNFSSYHERAMLKLYRLLLVLRVPLSQLVLSSSLSRDSITSTITASLSTK